MKRRSFVLFLIAALAWLQCLAPLLHTHLAGGGMVDVGLHVSKSLSAAGQPQLDADESPAVDLEHSLVRAESLPALAALLVTLLFLPPLLRRARPSDPARHRILPAFQHPPAQAPPA